MALMVSGESSGSSATEDEDVSGADNSSFEIKSLIFITRPATALSIFSVGATVCNEEDVFPSLRGSAATA